MQIAAVDVCFSVCVTVGLGPLRSKRYWQTHQSRWCIEIPSFPLLALRAQLTCCHLGNCCLLGRLASGRGEDVTVVPPRFPPHPSPLIHLRRAYQIFTEWVLLRTFCSSPGSVTHPSEHSGSLGTLALTRRSTSPIYSSFQVRASQPNDRTVCTFFTQNIKPDRSRETVLRKQIVFSHRLHSDSL